MYNKETLIFNANKVFMLNASITLFMCQSATEASYIKTHMPHVDPLLLQQPTTHRLNTLRRTSPSRLDEEGEVKGLQLQC